MPNQPNKRRKLIGIATASLVAPWLGSCGGSANGPQFSAAFESGSLPRATPLDENGLTWELSLRDDNDNPNLPNSFRGWWYFRVDGASTNKPMRLEFSRLGFPYYFVPLYSYDGKTWEYFEEKEVDLVAGCNAFEPQMCRLVIKKQFEHSQVWLARTYPYTTQDLNDFLAKISVSPYVSIQEIGRTPVFNAPLSLITIRDSASTSPKQTIWIHARTHPAETGSSYVLEGLIPAVTADDTLGASLREQYVFKIIPIHNIDGVIVGNYRTNATSINLENTWRRMPGSALLAEDAPLENRLLNLNGMIPALQDIKAPVVLALNLHASNSAPDTAAFFFPHFGSDPSLYTLAQQNLWRKQISFIQRVAQHYDGRIEQPPQDGGATFLNSDFPETWWWQQTNERVNAITLETTYGRAGFDHWVRQDDLRQLGFALAVAIAQMQSVAKTSSLAPTNTSLFRQPFRSEIYQDLELYK